MANPAAPMPDNPLQQLRDIHLPDPVSWWPPAPGWWLLGLLVAAALTALAIYRWRHWQKNRYRRQALRELAALIARAEQQPEQFLPQLNQLLKRTALSVDADYPAAGLSGEAWLAFLDRSGNTSDFSRGPGRVLLNGPYQPQPEIEQKVAVQELAAHWIRSHRRV